MATDLKSRIILCKNIKMDKNYNNVLSYSEEEMLNLCLANKVAELDDYAFIRTNNVISTNFSYETVLQSNYIAFQNKDYSNKWFFAWIDDIIYKGDRNTQIMYTIDSWSTWFDYWNANTCFVAREHVNNDTIGANTVDEGISVGLVQQISQVEDISLSQFYWVAIMSSWNPSTEKQFSGITIQNKNVFGKEIFVINANPISNLQNLLLFLFKANTDGHIADVGDIFIIPGALVDESRLRQYTAEVGRSKF